MPQRPGVGDHHGSRAHSGGSAGKIPSARRQVSALAALRDWRLGTLVWRLLYGGRLRLTLPWLLSQQRLEIEAVQAGSAYLQMASYKRFLFLWRIWRSALLPKAPAGCASSSGRAWGGSADRPRADHSASSCQ